MSGTGDPLSDDDRAFVDTLHAAGDRVEHFARGSTPPGAAPIPSPRAFTQGEDALAATKEPLTRTPAGLARDNA